MPGLAGIAAVRRDRRDVRSQCHVEGEYYGRHAPGLLFADDSGLEVDALGGAPGVYSARFAGPDATDEANNQLLLERMHGVAERTARFVCVIALADRGRADAYFSRRGGRQNSG